MRVQNILRVGAVKAFDITILHGFSRLNVLDKNIICLAPAAEGHASPFWPVIYLELQGLSMFPNNAR